MVKKLKTSYMILVVMIGERIENIVMTLKNKNQLFVSLFKKYAIIYNYVRGFLEKIINSDSAYVQKNDTAYLNSFHLLIPFSIFMKVFGNGVTIINDSNRYDFVKFDEESEIEFFKGLDWMIDYNEVKDLSEDEIIKLAKNIEKEREKIATTFNSMSKKEKNQHIDMVTKCDLLEFKFYSLRDILWLKQGHISIKLPENDKEKILKRNTKTK